MLLQQAHSMERVSSLLFGLGSAGAATIKYGELLLGELPFSHNLGLALTMVFGPCIVFSLVLAARGRS